jgi:hypothetical protein
MCSHIILRLRGYFSSNFQIDGQTVGRNGGIGVGPTAHTAVSTAIAFAHPRRTTMADDEGNDAFTEPVAHPTVRRRQPDWTDAPYPEVVRRETSVDLARRTEAVEMVGVDNQSRRLRRPGLAEEYITEESEQASSLDSKTLGLV